MAAAKSAVTNRTERARDPPSAARAFQSGTRAPDAAEPAAMEPGPERQSDSPIAASGTIAADAVAIQARARRRESAERAPTLNRLSRRTAAFPHAFRRDKRDAKLNASR